VQKILTRLPRPTSTYKGSGVFFRLYRAKDALQAKWNHPELKKLVLQSRQAYNRYGHRALLDQYDAKAAIYLCRATYKNNEEWLSIRMAPGNGVPVGGGELEIYRQIKGKSLDQIAKKKLFKGRKDFWSRIVSSSRMCGIHPYNVRTGQPIENPKHYFTGQCFALIHQQYIDDYPNSYDYVTAMIRNDFLKKGLAIENQGRKLTPLFTPAGKSLGIQPHRALLDRTVYAYAFPTYWFDHAKLSSFLVKMQKIGTLPNATFDHYLKTPLPIEVLTAQRSPLLAGLGDLFTQKNTIKHSPISATHLRRLLDTHVPEGPELKLTPAKTWNQRITQLISHANIKKSAK